MPIKATYSVCKKLSKEVNTTHFSVNTERSLNEYTVLVLHSCFKDFAEEMSLV